MTEKDNDIFSKFINWLGSIYRTLSIFRLIYMPFEGYDNALIKAIKNGYEEAIAPLIKKGANIKYKDKDGNTFLHLAVLSGNKNLVTALLEASIDPQTKNNQGKSADYLSDDPELVMPIISAASRFHEKVLAHTTRQHEKIKGLYGLNPETLAKYYSHYIDLMEKELSKLPNDASKELLALKSIIPKLKHVLGEYIKCEFVNEPNPAYEDEVKAMLYQESCYNMKVGDSRIMFLFHKNGDQVHGSDHGSNIVIIKNGENNFEIRWFDRFAGNEGQKQKIGIIKNLDTKGLNSMILFLAKNHDTKTLYVDTLIPQTNGHDDNLQVKHFKGGFCATNLKTALRVVIQSEALKQKPDDHAFAQSVYKSFSYLLRIAAVHTYQNFPNNSQTPKALENYKMYNYTYKEGEREEIIQKEAQHYTKKGRNLPIKDSERTLFQNMVSRRPSKDISR